MICRLVSIGAIAKTEAEYKGTVCRLLTEMRLEHDAYAIQLMPTIPFGWIADNTRWVRQDAAWSDGPRTSWPT